MSTLFMFLNMPAGSEWLLIFFAVLLLFGGKKIPELMRGVGRGIREFKDARSKVANEIEEGILDKNDKKELEKSN